MSVFDTGSVLYGLKGRMGKPGGQAARWSMLVPADCELAVGDRDIGGDRIVAGLAGALEGSREPGLVDGSERHGVRKAEILVVCITAPVCVAQEALGFYGGVRELVIGINARFQGRIAGQGDFEQRGQVSGIRVSDDIHRARGTEAVYGNDGIKGGWNAVNGGGDAKGRGSRGYGVGFGAGEEEEDG